MIAGHRAESLKGLYTVMKIESKKSSIGNGGYVSVCAFLGFFSVPRVESKALTESCSTCKWLAAGEGSLLVADAQEESYRCSKGLQ
jgi:hypothetical protein